MSEPAKIGKPKLAVIDRRGTSTVYVSITWKTGAADTWWYRAFDGISARKIERAIASLIQDSVLDSSDQLRALGFVLILPLVETT